MGQAEYSIFIVLATIILLVFIGGIVVFVFQYHKRKLLHEREKTSMNERHMRDLVHTQVQIQAQTMQDISREIHDSVGQRLTLASIYANQLAFDQQYPAIADRINTISDIINESLNELRSLSRSLASRDTSIGELEELVRKECERINALDICRATYSFAGGQYPISNTLKNFVLRIVQEFIQNSLKHSGCKNIDLAFDRSNEGLCIKAKDDGAGFDPVRQVSNGMGLENMKKRAELIGADFFIEGIPGKGTRLELFISSNRLHAC